MELMASIRFKIVTPERTVVEEEIYQITLPVEGGEVTLLPDHVPYIGAITAGEIVLRKTIGGEEESLATSGGFVEFHDNTLVILADTAERAEEIDLARAEQAKVRAEDRLKRFDDPQVDMERARKALVRAIVRLETAHKQQG